MYSSDFFRLLVDIVNYVEFNMTLSCIVNNIIDIAIATVGIIVIFKIINLVKYGMKKGYFDD